MRFEPAIVPGFERWKQDNHLLSIEAHKADLATFPVLRVEVGKKPVAPMRVPVRWSGPDLDGFDLYPSPVIFKFDIIGHDIDDIVASVGPGEIAFGIGSPETLPEDARSWTPVIDRAALGKALVLAACVSLLGEFVDGEEAAAGLAVAAGAGGHEVRAGPLWCLLNLNAYGAIYWKPQGRIDMNVSQRLHRAYERYWAADSHPKMTAAYYEILLLGGKDGYGSPGWRATVARWLRRVAAWVER